MFVPFYNSTIRNTVIAFGSLFNNIHIRRFTTNGTITQDFRVPLSYAPKERFMRMVDEPTSLGDGQTLIETTLPRMSFSITGYSYDPQRKINTLNVRRASFTESDTSAGYNYVGVPYNIGFQLDVATRMIDDGCQIIEQIVPYFTPSFNITVNLTEIEQKIDVPIVLNAVSHSEEYIGIGDDRRRILWNLQFTAKTYFYGPDRDSSVIREAQVNLFDWSDAENTQ